MNVRWRLTLALLQLGALIWASHLAIGDFFPLTEWFLSGVFGVVLALQLSEPFFTRPTDVFVSSVSVLILVLVADKSTHPAAWWAVGGFAGLGLLVAALGLLASVERERPWSREVNYRSFQFMKVFSGRVIYSAFFAVAVFSDFASHIADSLWLYGAWGLVLLSSLVRWDQVILGSSAARTSCECIGIVAPARLVVSSPSSLGPGSPVTVRLPNQIAEGFVVSRTPRGRGFISEIQLGSSRDAEAMLGRKLEVHKSAVGEPIIGIVSEGSTQHDVAFYPFTDIEVGTTVTVQWDGPAREVLYQVSELRIVEVKTAPSTSHLLTRAQAIQIGQLSDRDTLVPVRGIPAPGSPIRVERTRRGQDFGEGEGRFELGSVLGTDIPVWVDTDVLVAGHTAILGMTRMGKSSFALRLAHHLALRHPVVVVDQTGEYRKMGLELTSASNASIPGLTLKDLERSTTPHREALTALKALEALGRNEYASGTPISRVLIVEEAHQFVPEPSMLGFNVPGREEAIQFGLLMMQVRKFGVSVVLISQRTAVVAKSALSQCENVVAFKSVDQTGLDYLEALGGVAAKQLLPRLRQGEAIAMGPALSADTSLAVTIKRAESAPKLPASEHVAAIDTLK